MTVTLERPAEAPAEDDDVMHIVCHCSEDVTYCGMYMPGPMSTNETADDEWCPECCDVQDSMEEACPWGCRCEECGDSEPTGWDLLLQMYEQISGNQLAG